MQQPIDRHILEADGLQVTLPGGRLLLSDVYLRLETGTVTGLLGRNGSGKSSLLQAVFGPRAVPDASVRHNGRYAHPAYRQPGLVNYLPQTPLLPPRLTLHAAAGLLGVAPAQAFARLPELLARQHEPVGRLSGGKRRLAEATLLLHAPTHFTLLDEPFAGISPVTLELLAAEIQVARAGKGVLVSDHNYRELLPLCQRLYVLVAGALRPLDPARPELLVAAGYLPDPAGEAQPPVFFAPR
jgi:ABC-type multidrug transport system ATPase subunit